MRRAGLDYREFMDLRVHSSLQAFLDAVRPARLFAFSSKARVRFDRVAYAPGDALMFGSETRGLPEAALAAVPEDRRLYLPMRPDNRSLNLSNAVAIAVYEAWRQREFAGASR